MQLSLPKYASPVVQKYLRQLCPGYSELVTAYYSNKREELRSVAEKYAEVFAADQNSGLVEQVLQSQLRTSVKRLTKTFVTLSLSELAQRVGLGEDAGAAEAERLVVRMIGAGEIHARVSQRDGMVRFMSNPEQFDSVKVLAGAYTIHGFRNWGCALIRPNIRPGTPRGRLHVARQQNSVLG